MLLVRSEIARLQMREGQESVVTGHLVSWLSPGDHRAAGDVHITNTVHNRYEGSPLSWHHVICLRWKVEDNITSW